MTDTATSCTGPAVNGESSQATCLQASEITVRYGGLVALDRVSIKVTGRSRVGLIGPNGAGKSTLLSVVSGLRTPDSGQVFLKGIDVTRGPAQDRARLGLGRTFQHTQLFDSLTVREHLALADRVKNTRGRVWTDLFTGRGYRRPDHNEVERVDGLLERVGLTTVAGRTPTTLPLGLRRMVELGRALAMQPDVLILDEPCSGLDSGERARVAQLLVSLADDHDVAVLLIEHDVELVLRICQHVYVLDFGVCIAEGSPQSIRANRDVQAAYLGDALGGVA